jgi:hypothetical protein
VDPQHKVDARERAIRDHRLRAPLALLRGLEEHPHRSLGAAPAQDARRRRPHGGVAVVAAGVHESGRQRRVGGAALLLDGQGVEVHAQEDGPPPPPLRGGQETGAPHPPAHLEAAPLQERGHPSRGPGLRVGQLRMLVKVAAEGDHLRAQGEHIGREIEHTD